MVEQTAEAPELFLDEALDAIETERAILTAEIGAFEEFLETVESLTPTASTGHAIPAVRSQSGETDPFQSLRAAYESTVMSVPHYETEYGESFGENLRAEFGPDLATLLTAGRVFERCHKQAVVAATEECIDQRRHLLDAIDAERASVRRYREPVQSVIDAVEQFDNGTLATDSPELLDGYRKRIDVLESRCHDLVEQRQSEIVDDRRALSLSISGPDIPSYLYTDLPVTYPVIAPLTSALEAAAGIGATVMTDQSIRS
jgi:hypothetical protein